MLVAMRQLFYRSKSATKTRPTPPRSSPSRATRPARRSPFPNTHACALKTVRWPVLKSLPAGEVTGTRC